MNNIGKTLLLLIICLNIVTVIYSYGCTIHGSSCGYSDENSMLSIFFELDNFGSDQGALELTDEFSNQIEESIQQEGGVATGSKIAVFLDSLKMILGLIVMLTPLPILIWFYGLGIPLVYTIILAGPIFILYVISLMEFIGGRKW